MTPQQGSDRLSIYDLDYSDLENTLRSWGEPSYRLNQVWQGLYQRFWMRPEQFTSLPVSLRQRLAETYAFSRLTAVNVLDSKDGETRKTLFVLPDRFPVEAVRMRYKQRRTLCISTQSGCAMGCTFCATGQMGFHRHLSSGEIIEQVIYYASQLAANNETVTNIVLMGMGEPFHNYDSTIAAIRRMNHPSGMGLGARRFTISTVGLVPAIRRFAREPLQMNLAVSLHAADDELRSSLLPINRKYPLADLMSACVEYIDLTSRRISFEWALIQGVNDTQVQADKLVKLLQVFRRKSGFLCHVNIIPLNPTRKYRGKATTRNQAGEFKNILDRNGIPCSIRLRRGIDIQAGCGQLAADSTTDG